MTLATLLICADCIDECGMNYKDRIGGTFLTEIRAVMIHPGLYQLRGLKCPCGGELRVERCGSGEFLWEAFCAGCLECDPNGWPTLRATVIEGARYWREPAEVKL